MFVLKKKAKSLNSTSVISGLCLFGFFVTLRGAHGLLQVFGGRLLKSS
jgi:hypothetical protein